MSAQLTNQEIFDRVAAHLRKQGERSCKGARCLYRGPNETKCAIGIFIPDELYRSELEHMGVGELIDSGFVPSLPRSALPLTLSLQYVHDINPWARRGRSFEPSLEVHLMHQAKRYSLSYTAPEAT